MPLDPELIEASFTWHDRIQYDSNAPYTVRRRKNSPLDSRGQVSGPTQYDERTITNMRTQPLGDQEFARLPEGMRDQSWRFIEVTPDKPGAEPVDPLEFLDFGDQIQYKGHWYEVKFINDWDVMQSAKAVFTE